MPEEEQLSCGTPNDVPSEHASPGPLGLNDPKQVAIEEISPHSQLPKHCYLLRVVMSTMPIPLPTITDG